MGLISVFQLLGQQSKPPGSAICQEVRIGSLTVMATILIASGHVSLSGDVTVPLLNTFYTPTHLILTTQFSQLTKQGN